jgi:hypothetical protein
MRNARQSVSFAAEVEIVPAAGGRTGATEPLADEASSPETSIETVGTAIVSNALPVADNTNPPAHQDSPVTSRTGGADVHSASSNFRNHIQPPRLSLTQDDRGVTDADQTDAIGASMDVTDTHSGSSGGIIRTQPRRQRTVRSVTTFFLDRNNTLLVHSSIQRRSRYSEHAAGSHRNPNYRP